MQGDGRSAGGCRLAVGQAAAAACCAGAPCSSTQPQALLPSRPAPQLDPWDPRRLAFHLGCGWSGVLDLPSGAVTHLHAPAHVLEPEEPGGSQADGSSGAAGGGGPTALQLLLQMSTAAPGAGAVVVAGGLGSTAN